MDTEDGLLNVDDGVLKMDDSPSTSGNVKFTTNMLSRSMSKISNMTTYSSKKTMAQGMMDIALLTANANQLGYIIEHDDSKNFLILLPLIVCSLVLQVLVGILLIFKGQLDNRNNRNNNNRVYKIGATQINNYVVLGVFLITVINIFITAFTIVT